MAPIGGTSVDLECGHLRKLVRAQYADSMAICDFLVCSAFKFIAIPMRNITLHHLSHKVQLAFASAISCFHD